MFNLDNKWLLAIIPAIIVGLFAISPKIYDKITEPKAGLKYIITESPNLDVGNGHIKKILSIKTVNTGRTTLSSVRAVLLIESGKIEKFKLHETTNLNPNVNSSDEYVSIDIDKLHHNEIFVISAMLIINNNKKDMVYNVRCNEIVGERVSEIMPLKKFDLASIQGSILAALAVLSMVFLGKNIALKNMGIRGDILFYIISAVGIKPISHEIKFTTDLSFIKTADILFFYGVEGDERCKKLAIKALYCMLFVKDMAEISLKNIKTNIKNLDPDNYSEDKINIIRNKSVNIGKFNLMKENIQEYINSNI